MANNRIGYSLMKLSDNSEVSYSGRLPWTFDYSSGKVTFDKVGLVAPSSDNPTHQLVERWGVESSPPAANTRLSGYGSPVWNATEGRMELEKQYIAIPQAELDEDARRQTLSDDANTQILLDWMNTHNAVDIRGWIANNITTMDDAKEVITRLTIMLARK